jgi:hypothetical protein
MENNFNKIRILREEIQQLHKESETLCKNNPIILNSLKKIKDELSRLEKESIENLFDGNLNISEDDTIKSLTAIKGLIQWIINREKLIRNPSQNETLKNINKLDINMKKNIKEHNVNKARALYNEKMVLVFGGNYLKQL